MNIAIHSDLHTEISMFSINILKNTDLLILAGDIGSIDSLPRFFEQLRCSNPQLPVIYVLGNHDRYGFTVSAAVAECRRIAAHYEIRLLDNEAVIFEDVLFCGTTLWSNFYSGGDAAKTMAWVDDVLPDGQQIFLDDGTPLSAKIMQQWFLKACDFIQNSCQQAANVRKKVVISHFLPARELLAPQHQKTADDRLRSAYWVSDIPEIYRLADVWIYGHSHSNIECRLGNTQFLTNQRGYHRLENRHHNHGYRRDYQFTL